MMYIVVLILVKRSWPLLTLTFALLLSSPSFAYNTHLGDTQEADNPPLEQIFLLQDQIFLGPNFCSEPKKNWGTIILFLTKFFPG